MKDYGIMEIFIADQQQMRAEDGKQEIYLEWPNRAVGLRYFNHSSFIKRNAVISNDNALCEKKDCWERSMTFF